MITNSHKQDIHSMDKTKLLIAQVEEIISPVYLVGGSVRDMLLGRKPKDFDFTTPMSPDDVEARVKATGHRAYSIGKRFGTIGFKLNGNYVEVTTFRQESYTPNNRKPQVKFVVDLRDDLSRRDFTINAIALSSASEYFDPFSGRLDIIARKIKAVGSPRQRFTEDPLRMLRAARLASQLDFEVDPNLIGYMRKCAPLILSVARERWVQEMDKLLLSPSPMRGLEILVQTRVMDYMIPSLSVVLSTPRAERLALDLRDAPLNADTRWGVLLSYIGHAYDTDTTPKNDYLKVGLGMAVGTGLYLRFSNDRMDEVNSIFRLKSVGYYLRSQQDEA
jgi:tRNA nucleotidyltransferase/poly(A) polymerase